MKSLCKVGNVVYVENNANCVTYGQVSLVYIFGFYVIDCWLLYSEIVSWPYIKCNVDYIDYNPGLENVSKFCEVLSLLCVKCELVA